MPTLVPHSAIPEAASQITALLERHRGAYPFLEEELQRQRALSDALAERRSRAEPALIAWQAALAQRWSCEVAAQRACWAVRRQLDAHHGDDTIYGPLIASTQPGAATTPRALLQEVRRLEAALELLAPRPPFAGDELARLRAAGDALAAAIERTDSCEAERRSLLSEQRVVANLLQRAYERSLRLLARYNLEEQL